MITFAYDPERQATQMKKFFECLPFVLPCKYCRSNLVDHYAKLPIEKSLGSRKALTKWLYDIHTLVNEKLRSQGQSIPTEPPFDVVEKHYTERLDYGCSKTFFPGWEFLFSIVESHPLRKDEYPHALPGAPPLDSIDASDTMTLLRWNLLSKKDRYNAVVQFWNCIPSVLPFSEWQRLWKQTAETTFPRTKDAAFRSLWSTRKLFEEELDLLNKTSYHDLCKMIRYYKSGCASSTNAKKTTCRRLRSSTRKQNRK